MGSLPEPQTLSPDYLVVGAGAMGMAFVDTLLSDSKFTVAIIDRYHQPGGHWTTVYPYVRLHQPSQYYGVNSRPLGDDTIDLGGWNEGLHELATGNEVCAYFSQVMNQTFLPSGRVEYYPKCDYNGDGAFSSILTGQKYKVGKTTRIVDATYMNVRVPSMGPPSYEVGEGVELVTPNDLPKVERPYANYTVIGAGKTGMDACLWLLSMNVDPSKITWVKPRDAWMLDRGGYQPYEPGSTFEKTTLSNVPKQVECIYAATSVDDLLHRLQKADQLLRFDDEVWPTMFRCATISRKEYEALKTIEDVVRKGRVVRLEVDKVILEQGTYAPEPDTLFIDCSTDGLAKRPSAPVFQQSHITLQPVRFCQQNFSAAFIAHVESTYSSSLEKEKNHICRPIPHPNHAVDWLVVAILNHQNTIRWNSYPQTLEWLQRSRLDWLKHWVPALPEDSAERKAAVEQTTGLLEGVVAKLESLIETLGTEDKEIVKAQVYGSE